METHNFLINVEEKLRSLTRFTGSRGVIYYDKDRIYAFPEEPGKNLKMRIESGDELNASDLPEPRQHTKTITLQKGKLILIDPTAPVQESTLRFLGDQFEEEIHLAAVFDNLFKASVAISSNLNLKALLHKVMSFTEDLLKNEVSAVMLLDPSKEELYWEVSRGDKSELFEGKLTLQLGQGIAGTVAVTGEAVLVNDVHRDPKWDDSFDKITGFHTRSMICVPITFRGNILGVIEVINKKEGDFTDRDLQILEMLSTQTGVAIENAKIHGQLEKACEELNLLNKAKERVINHLAHELKTPLALISGVFERITRLFGETPNEDLVKAVRRGQRNVNRLIDLQEKIADILDQRSVEEKDKILFIIEDAISFLEEAKEEYHYDADLIERVSSRIESLFGNGRVHMEELRLDEYLDELCDEGIRSLEGRDLTVNVNIEKGINLTMDRGILCKSFLGLFKNAAENTPDEGKIDITAFLKDGDRRIEVRDYGVGITEENQKLIFGGFFHTQDTKLYTSKRPYQFNAGGTGSDLLRIKSFAKRLGFSIDFESTRCRFIPTDNHKCAGRVSACPFIRDRSECLSSGGSRFSLTFPAIPVQ